MHARSSGYLIRYATFHVCYDGSWAGSRTLSILTLLYVPYIARMPFALSTCTTSVLKARLIMTSLATWATFFVAQLVSDAVGRPRPYASCITPLHSTYGLPCPLVSFVAAAYATILAFEYMRCDGRLYPSGTIWVPFVPFLFTAVRVLVLHTMTVRRGVASLAFGVAVGLVLYVPLFYATRSLFRRVLSRWSKRAKGKNNYSFARARAQSLLRRNVIDARTRTRTLDHRRADAVQRV